MSALLGRHARVAVIIEKDNTIEAKKAFVRYISHEIRTPLNTCVHHLCRASRGSPPDASLRPFPLGLRRVCLGLDVLGDDLKASSNPLDRGRCDTIEDIAASCQVALSILVGNICICIYICIYIIS